MNKLVAVRIKYEDQTYSDQIPIGVLAENVQWDEFYNLKNVLGVIDIDKGTVQSQIDQKLESAQLKQYVDNEVKDSIIQTVQDWLDEKVNPTGSVVMVDNSLTITGAAADAGRVGEELDFLKADAEVTNTQIQNILEALNNVSIDPDDLGLEQDPDTYYVYPTYKGVRSENGIPLASSGGGGGGGGDVVDAVLTVTNTTGWLSKTIAEGASCPVSFNWSSIEDEFPTGDGTIRITVNETVRATMQISQGNVSVDLKPYLSSGMNKVKVRISDVYDQGKTITFTVTSIALSISSSFDVTKLYDSTIAFAYTPTGAVEKTVHFILDGTQIGTQVTTTSGRQMTYTIPQQSHGGHSLQVYFTCFINGQTVTSNELYYEFRAVDPSSDDIIITSSFSEGTFSQYSSIVISYFVYNPASLTSSIQLAIDGTTLSTQTVDRTEQNYTYRANDFGEHDFTITCGNVTKTIELNIVEADIDVEAETDSLALFLSSQGRSNQQPHPNTWVFNPEVGDPIACTFTNFNWSSDGWQSDDDGITVMRVAGDARLTIPYRPFERDFRSTGKTIELEFATRNVLNYDATILSCMSNGRGISIGAQKAVLSSEQSEISTQYKEDEHVRITFVAQKRSENRLLYIYIDSIPSGVIQYPVDDDFSQIEPVNITVGSNDCAIDLYCIRIYDNDLTRYQILNNWIADTQVGATMLDRYTRNAVYDAYGNVVIANLPSTLPYFILNAEELPQYKGDKKTITGSYVDPIHPSRSFTFTNCQINVQGTSSAVYARKNYDMQFKGGFEMTGGNHASSYALRPGAIPFNRFVLKADVASSEGANNVELVRLYNDACPYKTPEMVSDSRVRWGIDGFPIIVFWNNTTTQELKFWGKFNFNLPKRAPAPYGYANDDTMESWQFQNNTSNLMLFQSDYFDETMYTDPDTGDTKELWRYDYEARFPQDTWTNYSILQEFQSFIYSTWRSNATGDVLSEPVTYEGVTYTNDTAAYRLAKFRAEFPTYAELNSFLFYYIFTELFLMVDSRAKNLFIGFNGSPITASGRVATRKATAQPYDMDTAIGINNEGTLTFGYGLEDTDHLQGGANIFNGQESVLWCNIRDAFNTEIRQLYQTLRSNGVLSYATIEKRFEDHQEIWPEAIWIEDAKFKYIDPLTDPDPGKESTADYLSMLQGSKEQQRKWWLTNRFKYMDSKWNAGDALSQVIILRGYEKANITVTPYTDIYPTIKYASYVVQQRGTHGQPTLLVCPLDTVSDTEISIYSAPQLASVGDLSALKVGFANFSEATRLQSIKIGDADSSYENTNLYSLTLGNNVLLKTLDVRNCSGLGDTSQEGHTQTVVDISNCSIIEEVYFDGTKVQGVTLPNGGVLKVLHLPDTITNLTILNQNAITDLTVGGYSNISTLRIENCPTVNTKAILNSTPASARVRLIGFYWEAQDATEIYSILDKLDTMRGLDEQGENVNTAQVSGTIHTASLTGSQIADFNSRYPYLTVTADHTSAQLKFYNGSTLITTQTVLDGGDGSYTGSTPTKTQDAQYTYTFAGWSKDTDDGTVDSDALNVVVADRNVYACFTNTLRKYTVIWKNGTTTLETDTNVPYGSIPHYDGATPTSGGQTSTGWLPDPTQPIIGDTTFTAQYLPVYTITFKNDTGTTTLDTQNVVQGGTAVYGGTTPTSSEDASLAWLGWATSANSHTANAVLTNIQASATVYAAFEIAVEVVEITDSWDTIIANIDNGTYSTVYKVGNYKPLDLGTEGTINMQIVAMDADELADGSGYAPLTFLGMELLATKYNFNSSSKTVNGTSGYAAGGWQYSDIRNYLQNTILPLINTASVVVANRIQLVTKKQLSNIANPQVTDDKLWLPSALEVGDSLESFTAVSYNSVFKNDSNRIKYHSGTANYWWLRSSTNSKYARLTTATGSFEGQQANGSRGVCLGFCLGESPEPDLKYLNYTKNDTNMTITINGLNIAQIVVDDLQKIKIPDTIQGYHVILN